MEDIRLLLEGPNTLYGGASQGSAPAYDASKKDHYRNAIDNNLGDASNLIGIQM